MTTPPRSPLAPPGEAPITSARHVFDTAVADELIRAMRATLPDDPHSDERLRAAVLDYVDAARARGETHERMLTAVRHTVTALVTSAAWSGVNRPVARNLIEVNVALASARFYMEDAFRDAQPSTAFHFEVRSDGEAPSPKAPLSWADEES